jgi:hypothetical protein
MVIGGVHASSAAEAIAAADNGDVTSLTINAPSVTTLGADRLILRLICVNNNSTQSFATATSVGSISTTNTIRQVAVGSQTQAVAGATGTETISSATGNQRTAATLAIAPAASGWSGRTAPNGIVLIKGLTGALADIDDDPDSPDSNWLVVS